MRNYQIRFSGSGGQGLQLTAKILAAALVRQGRHVSQSQSYEPTSRGGLSRSDLVVSDGEVDYPLVTRLDYLLILDQLAVSTSDGMIADNAIVLVDTQRVDQPPKGKHRTLSLPLLQEARRIGNLRAANVVSLAVLLAVGELCDRQILEATLKDMVPKRYLQLNLTALAAGYELSRGQV